MGLYNYTFIRMPDPPTAVSRYYEEPQPEQRETNTKEMQIKDLEKKNPRLANQLKSVLAKEKLAKGFKFGMSDYERTKASPKRKKKKK